jgi:uroporphyrinogen-III synthase
VMRAHEHAEDLVELLEGQGGTVIVESDTPLDIYRMLLDRKIDVVTFTSASTVRNFVRLYGVDPVADLLQPVAIASIGPVTAEAALQCGIRTAIMPDEYTIPGLVQAIVEHFAQSSTITRSVQELR